MGKIIATCGHEVISIEDIHNVCLPSQAMSFEEYKMVRAICYLSLCKDCYDEYKKLDIILDEERIQQYLNEEIDFEYIW
jgi:hypothetical protein